MHGMPVAFLMGLVENANKPKDIVYIGLRDVDQDEKETLRKLGIKAFSVCFKMFPTVFLLT